MRNDNTRAILLISLSGLTAFIVTCLLEPGYFVNRGFPLDDAWIHQVYAREFARSGMLAYNPGHPATGATSPLWVILLSIPHLLFSSNVEAVVLFTKLLGFTIHLLAALWMYRALTVSSVVPWRHALAGSILVAIHPDFIAASVSGMEVSLTILLMSLWLGSLWTHRPVRCVLFAALAFLARPESAVAVGTISVLAALPHWRDRMTSSQIRCTIASLAGILLSAGGLALRNWSVSGLPMPATFYSKVVTVDSPNRWNALLTGLSKYFEHIVILDATLLVYAGLVVAVICLYRSLKSPPHMGVSAIFMGGIFWCLGSFYLLPFYFGDVFYHQRHVLPGAFLILTVLPAMMLRILKPLFSSESGFTIVCWGLAIFGLLNIGLTYPKRWDRFANDARNIDDVQVAEGRFLAELPDDSVVWVVDAGATRFFGNGYYVDQMALNSFPLLTDQKDAYLRTHPPDFIQLVPTWNRLSPGLPANAEYWVFEPTTRYTVTRIDRMKTHVLLRCDPERIPQGILHTSKRQEYPFTCGNRLLPRTQ